MSRYPRARVALLAVLASAIVVNSVIALAGAQPADIVGRMLSGTLGNPYGLGQWLARATPLMLTGASVALALRAGLFNVGAEGQVTAGVLAAAVAGAALPAATPAWLAVPAAALAAAAAGALLGGLCGWLRGRFGAHEVVSTLMTNGLMAVLATWLYGGVLRDGAQVSTRPILGAARVPTLDRIAPLFRGSSLNATVLLALAIPFVVDRWLLRTSAGLRVRAVGDSHESARAVGISVSATYTKTMAIAGALAGLAATHFVLGVKGAAEDGLGAGVGFAGLAVAVIAQGRALGLVAAALLMALLAQGGLVVGAVVPADVLVVVQAVVLVAAAAVAVRWHAPRSVNP